MSTTTNTQAKAQGSRQTRGAILKAAKRLILIKGYNATSVDDLLHDSGVGKGSFYHYFKSKEDLGYAILDDIVSSFVERTLDPCFADPEVGRSPRSAVSWTGRSRHSGRAPVSAGVRWGTWPLSCPTFTRASVVDWPWSSRRGAND